MALANTRYNIQNGWFSDMRVHSLEKLVSIPIENVEELGSSMQLVVTKLGATEFYAPLFEAAFGSPEITPDRISRALAQFLRALISYRARFDLAYNPMTSEPPAPTLVLSEQELRGAEIFGSDASSTGICMLCHQRNGLANEQEANNGLDVVPTDPGIRGDGAVGVFRAAALRNIAVTAPYMHDGRFATLRDVIDHYDHGIQDSAFLPGILRSSSGPKRLNLSEEDKQALEAFLRTFTDDEFLRDPKFSDPFR